jgi:hypothetical protein
MENGPGRRAVSAPAPALRSEFLLQIVGELSDPQDVGETSLGARRIFCMRGGTFCGPDIAGEVLPGGGDWVLVRRDGVAQLDIRMTLRTDDGELVYVSASGILDMSPELRARILRGESVDPAQYYFRTALAFETSAEKYRGLNRLVAVGVGRRTATGMVTDVFAIR